MKKVFLHSKKVICNHWFLIAIAWAVSFIFGILAFLAFLIYSLAFTEDPVDVKDVLNNFTEEELGIVLSETVDENVSDDEYLSLLARYQSYFCPKKLDHLTTWVGAENTKDAYILYYEIKNDFDNINHEILRTNILAGINKNSVHAIRMARSHKEMVFKYTDRKTNDSFEITISSSELMAA